MFASAWRERVAFLWKLSSALLLLALIAAPPALAADARVALVIGNSEYQNVGRLPNPANDAAALAAALQRLGFAVTSLRDASVGDMRRALQDFEVTAAGAEIALVYYAGHGIEMNGTNYLIPVDAELKRDTHVEDEAIPLDRVERAAEGASRLRLILLDACRDNPFVVEMERNAARRSIGRGLARVEPPAQTLVAYAAKGGTTADDGDGDHSPYATSLLRHIETPGLELNFLFRIVHDEVLEETGGAQEPFVYGSLGATEIYLKPADAPSTQTEQTLPPAAASQSTDDQLAEADYFAAITANTEETYRAFLRDHPTSPRKAQVNSLLSALAENRLWTTVADEDTVASYQRYLAAFENGVYADEARTRMQRLIDDLRREVATRSSRPPSETANECGHPHGSYRVVGIASDDVLWVRTEPRRESALLGSMPPNGGGIGVGSCVSVPGYAAPWCQVRYKCVAGWAYGRYLTDTGGGTISAPASGQETFRVVGVASNDALNVRSGPGTGYGVVAEIPPNGSGVSVSGCQAVSGYSSKWCLVSWLGANGWASACCLASERTGRKPD
jgi:uncharacterized caspase-like protein/uncharacterized protein YraI